MLHIAICEDEEIWKKQLLTILEKLDTKEYEFSIFSSGEALLTDYHPYQYDLIFMDIYMNGISGVDTVAEIRKQDSNVMIAFTTTSPDHALEGYRLNVIRYLEKPVKEKDVLDTIHFAKINKEANCKNLEEFEKKGYCFSMEQVLFLEQNGHNIEAHLQDGSIHTLSGKLDLLEKDFEKPPFYRSHKSYLVNLSKVNYLDKEMNLFVMKDGSCAYIKRDKMKEAALQLDQFLFDSLRKDMK